jgi:hypothetical protein
MRDPRVRLLVRIALLAITGVLLARAFADVDWRATWHVIAVAGPTVLLVLVPFGVVLLLDASGVVLAARAAGIELRPAATLGVRVVSEAFHYGAPGGVVASEAAALALFMRRCALELHEAVVVLAGRKQLVMRAHTGYLLLAASWGAAALTGVHTRAAWLVAASALVPLASSVVLGLAMRRAPRFERARPYTTRFFDAFHVTVPATFVFLAAWCVEAAETAVILRVVGVSLSMSSVLAVEGMLSLARSAVAFVPGGLGVQDVGYATALAAFGVPHDQAAAFVLLKRAKELAWIAAGFALYFVEIAPPSRALAGAMVVEPAPHHMMPPSVVMSLVTRPASSPPVIENKSPP